MFLIFTQKTDFLKQFVFVYGYIIYDTMNIKLRMSTIKSQVEYIFNQNKTHTPN